MKKYLTPKYVILFIATALFVIALAITMAAFYVQFIKNDKNDNSTNVFTKDDNNVESYPGNPESLPTSQVPQKIDIDRKNVKLSGKNKRLTPPDGWLVCDLTKDYGVKLYYPKEGKCEIFGASWRQAEITFPTKTTSGKETTFELRVVINNPNKLIDSESGLANNFGGASEIENLNIKDKNAKQYITHGAEGSLFRKIMVELNTKKLIVFEYQIKEFPGDSTISYSPETTNPILETIINSFEYNGKN